MNTLNQENRQTRIDTPLGTDVLLLHSLSGVEALSSGFTYTLKVLSEDPSIDGNALIGKQISVAYADEDGRDRYYNGFVSRFEYEDQVEEPVKATAYQLEMVPWTWFLRHNSDCQIFQEISTPDIIKKIFNELGFNDFRIELTENYPTREYCVQYNESDFNFVSRLMEEEGIFYYFEHTKDKHTLVLCDSPAGYFDISETDVRYTPIGQTRDKQLTSWRHVYEFRPGKVAQKDFNFKKPTDGLATDVKSKVKFEVSSKLEQFEYPGLYGEGSDGDRLTKVRLEELEAEHDYVVGSGYYLNFSPGGKFDVDKHTRPDEEGRAYALIEVQTEINSNFGFGQNDGDDFSNTFRCIPAETTFRPQRTSSKPVVEGPQTAIVTTDGQEIVVDEHARVKVQFHWDRYGQKDVNSSCWIRVSQVHAGAGWGMIDIPRKDEEVIVSFLNGDPDRPIITGRVYNGDNQPPFGLKGAGNNSKNKTRRGNTTKSYEADGFNEITMDDTAGEEQIRIHAQHNLDAEVQNDETWTVHHDRKKTIDNDETTVIGNHRTENVLKGNEKVTIEEGDRTVIVKQGDDTHNVELGAQSTTVEKDATVTVKKGDRVVSVETGSSKITAKTNVEITGMDKIQAIGTNEVSISGKVISITAEQKLTIGIGNNLIEIDKQGVKVGGTQLTMEAVGVCQVSGAIVKLN